MKRYVPYLLFAFSLVLTLSYFQVGYAGNDVEKCVSLNTAESVADVFLVAKLYNFSVSDGGEKIIIACTVVEVKNNWVACSANYKGAQGQTINKNLWLNADNITVVHRN